MSSSSHLEAATLTVTTQKRAPDTAEERRVPALSILWHPDLSRVGELALLRDLPLLVSRAAPLFFRADNAADRQPLADQFLSYRNPCLELRTAEGQQSLELRKLADDKFTIDVAGAPLDLIGTRVPLAALEQGLTITLCNRIVLCLHWAVLPVIRGPRLDMVGDSDSIEAVRRSIRQVADLDVPVLLRGENGTGKELVAQAIAKSSKRKGAFVAVNMGAIQQSTAVAALFGHDRGAFTGATAERAGYFGEADDGTLFLDEIGTTSLEVQEMLLRVLETGEIQSIGARRPRKVNVRVVAATNANLEQAVAAGSFREDLFHRLAGYQIHLPPLRTRRSDFGSLLLHFLRGQLAVTGDLDLLAPHEDNQRRPWLDASIVANLATNGWSGNVRHLFNVARQLAITSRGLGRAKLDPVVLELLHQEPRPLPRARAAVRPDDVRNDPSLLAEALRRHNGSTDAAAKELGLAKSTVYRLVDELPELKVAATLPTADILRVVRECGDDLDTAAKRLGVSKRGIQQRLRSLGRQDNGDPSNR